MLERYVNVFRDDKHHVNNLLSNGSKKKNSYIRTFFIKWNISKVKRKKSKGREGEF